MKLCIECKERPALAISFKKYAAHKVHAIKNHDLCRQCWRSLIDRSRQPNA